MFLNLIFPKSNQLPGKNAPAVTKATKKIGHGFKIDDLTLCTHYICGIFEYIDHFCV